MLKNAAKRCQATPQVMLRPTTYSQTMPESSLISAKIETMSSLAGRRVESGPETQSVAQWKWWPSSACRASLPALTKTMPRPSRSTTISTKYAALRSEPSKRLRPFRWLTWRMMIRTVMPMTVPRPRNSSIACHQTWSDSQGQPPRGLNVWM